MVVATAALCADRGATAAAISSPQRVPTRSFATKLTSSLRRSVSPAVRMISVRTEEKTQSFPLPIRHAASGVRSEFSPFQFRLPPPSL